MANDYVSVMDKIKRAHAFFNAVRCMEFDYSVDRYLGYWYAEERFYVIKDCMMDGYYFVIAGNPAEAIQKIKDKAEEVSHYGEYVPESEEW